MTEIPIEEMDLPIKYEEFKIQLLERQSKLEDEGMNINGVLMHYKTLRTVLSLVYEKENSNFMPPQINWYYKIFGMKVFPSSEVPETEYYFVVE